MEGEFSGRSNTRAGDQMVFGVNLAAKLIRLYASTDVELFVHDIMQSAIPQAARNDRYNAKSLYMAEGRLTSVEGRRLNL